MFAAGDATDFAVKHGRLAPQQADAAAQAIAARSGPPIDPTPFDPEIHAIFLGCDKPLYLNAHLAGRPGRLGIRRDGCTPTSNGSSR